MTDQESHVACGCSSLIAQPLTRRHLIAAALAAAGTVGLDPTWAQAAEGNYEAMLLSCIDPRFTGKQRRFMTDRHLRGKYSHFSFAGAAIGAVAPSFADWHKTFWDNLATSIQLHRIRSVVALNHRDCGAAKIAYGDAAVANRAAETETHRAALAEFRKQAGERQPTLRVITALLALDGSMELLG
jgi:hypothetical protein